MGDTAEAWKVQADHIDGTTIAMSRLPEPREKQFRSSKGKKRLAVEYYNSAMFDNIEKDLRVCLCVQPRPMRNALAGRGAKKNARNDGTTKRFAEAVATYISRVYHCYDGKNRAGVDDVGAVIFGALSALPDETLKRYADKLALISDPAVDELAEKIHLALSQKWAISYHPCTKPPHSSSFDGALRRWGKEMLAKEQSEGES